MKNGNNKSPIRTAKILGSALVAAAWLIAGPDLLQKWGLGEKVYELLIWFPAMSVFFLSIAGDKQLLACEARSFRRLINR